MKDLNTPLWQLTVGEFLELQQVAVKEEPVETTTKKVDFTGDHYVHGIAGIAHLLGCSKSMVHRHRADGWINPAISQRGRTIICDAPMALELFKKQKNERVNKRD
jgi:hypothetical protein